MKRLILSFVLLTFLQALVPAQDNKKPADVSFSLFAGPHYGGIIDNKKADAVTSATKWGGRLGLSAEFGIGRHYLEAGLDYLYFTQGLTFYEGLDGFAGTRNLYFHELRLPVMYNFHFLAKNRAYPMLTAGLGPYLGVLLSQNSTVSGSVPAYTLKNAEIGLRVNCSYYPLVVSSHFPMGFYLDFYRGFSPFYEDQYHSFFKNMTGNLSTLSLGIIVKYLK
jgi:hypothetical protein